MRIIYVKVSNYRNVDGIEVTLNPDCNYIIGENNLGKSNFLSLLATVCGGKGFDEKDFADPEKPIEVELHLQLHPNERGFFADNFSPDDSSILKIRYRQTINEAHPKDIQNLDSYGDSMPVSVIRKINFFRYETTSTPSHELRLDSQKGAGPLISAIIERFINGQVPSFLNEEQVDGLMTFINEYLNKIRSFKEYSIKAMIAPNSTDMLTSLFYLSDGDRKIETTGSGVQYLAMASINILCQIMRLYKSKLSPFSEQLFTDDSGKKMLPLVLSIDEPEVHLGPYLQRSLIGYYNQILRNKDTDFAELLKTCFGVDGIDGQLIIVTHSTDALVGDYRNLIRFYKKDGVETSAVSGYALSPQIGQIKSSKISKEDEKHLRMRFTEIKEAFYAKCAILIEGETEYGCIDAFAKKLGIPLDDFGICVINARGEKSIRPLRQLLALFAVPSVAIYDSDIKSGKVAHDDEFYTKELCYEIEIVKLLYSHGKQNIVKRIASELDSRFAETHMDFDMVSKHFKKMGIELYVQNTCENCGHTQKMRDAASYSAKRLSEVADDDEDDFCKMYSAWYMSKKGILLGRIIGEILPTEYIPACYRNAIEKAHKVAINA